MSLRKNQQNFLTMHTLFLPYSGYVPETSYVENKLRGLLWSTPGTGIVYASTNYINGASIGYALWSTFPLNCYAVRCVRNI